jgi:thimet oligopeptidase
LLASDVLFGQFYNDLTPIYLLANTAESNEVRKIANEIVLDLSNFIDEISLDKDLYSALKSFEKTPEASNLSGTEARLLKKTIENFDKNGFVLPENEREELKKLRFQINDLETQYQKNIAESHFEYFADEQETEGLPEFYKNERRQNDGKFKITLDAPSFQPLMRYAKNDNLRKKIYFAYLNRAADKNVEILTEILILRKKSARMLRKNSYAEFVTESAMSGNTARVHKFLSDLETKMRPKALQELSELKALRDEFAPELAGTAFEAWQTSFWSNLLLEKKYQVNSQLVQEYFEQNAVFEAVFDISDKLFGITIEKTDLPKYHADVQTFCMKENGKILAYFYLDNFPRPGKYTHAACFGLGKSGNLYEKNAVSRVALVCNFPKPTPERPSLLTLGQVTTVFHEFGHLLHKVLSESRYYTFTGTNVPRDFVEVPSQMFESWCNEYEILKKFAKHYQTGEIFPKDLFENIIASKNFGQGLHILQQIFYGNFDFILHDEYDAEKGISPNEICEKLFEKITVYKYPKGTHFEANFGHLMGYAASYYGYLWSLVYAEDMFSVFAQEGVLRRETGLKYREKVLAKGNDREAYDIICDFLGREPNETAFLRSISAE